MHFCSNFHLVVIMASKGRHEENVQKCKRKLDLAKAALARETSEQKRLQKEVEDALWYAERGQVAMNPPPPPPPLPASTASATAVDLIAFTEQKFADKYRTVALSKKHRLQRWLLQQHQQRERDRLDLLEYAFDHWNKTVSQV